MSSQPLDKHLLLDEGKPASLVLMAFLIVIAGGLVGGLVNLVNGLVSETYFRNIMGWDFEGIWIAAVLLGATQGLMYSLVLTVMYTMGFGMLTKGQAGWSFARRQMLKMLGTVLGLWLMGGLFAVLAASMFPDFYIRVIRQVPRQTGPMLAYAWAGGSIWGVLIGGVLAVLHSLRSAKREWPLWQRNMEEHF